MSLPIGDIISELNKDTAKKPTSISVDAFFKDFTVDGPDIETIDYTKYCLALLMKEAKRYDYTICHKTAKNILKNSIIRKHYLDKLLRCDLHRKKRTRDLIN